MIFKNPHIAVIGAGKFANSLAPALVSAGFKISAVISRSSNSAKSLANKTGCKTYSVSSENIPVSTNIFFLTVPDSEIKKTAMNLSNLNLDFGTSLFIHCSGSLKVSQLKSLKAKKAMTASFHIMQTFPSKKSTPLTNSFAAIETSDKKAERFLFRLSKRLKLNAFRLESEQKTAYHLAGVFASNFIAGNFQNSYEIFQSSKSIKSVLNKILYPTALTTLENIRRDKPSSALSGPVERGETDTIKNHLKVLRSLKQIPAEKKKLILVSYLTQSLLLIYLSEEKHRSLKVEHKEVKKLLMSELKTIEF